jgi:hypothetical protein
MGIKCSNTRFSVKKIRFKTNISVVIEYNIPNKTIFKDSLSHVLGTRNVSNSIKG